MNGSLGKLSRCAIYTRKSTEHNLDLAFTSLDAQREACEAYITSQAGEGWRLVGDHYDDGAFSGASLERPALQRLLADVRARRIDSVVVYKVDRLTRSLADFAKLIELFETHGVSFVSVTQSFNTRSSMGRLTLNVLLSFAQFERELIGERVRDKIAASKRKGLWVGGPVPLGYAAVDKKIMVVPAEAEAVRTIFERYLTLGSIRALADELDRQAIRSKSRRLSNGRTVGGGRFGVGALAYLLKNRFYIGEVVYRGEVHRGDHAPILDRPLFEAVQAELAVRAVARRCRLRGSPAILSGRLFDICGNRMSPSHTNRGGARYRYYVSQAVLQGKPQPVGLLGRVPAAEVEAFVVAALRNHLNANGAGEQLPDNDLELLERHLDRVTLTPKHLELRLRQSVELAQADDPANNGPSAPHMAGVTTITVPLDQPCVGRPQRNHPCAGPQYADQAEPTRGASDRDRQGPRLGRRVGPWSGLQLGRACQARRQGRAAHPALAAARVPLTTNCLEPPRRHRAGGPHHHGACSRAALVLGRAGATLWAELRLTSLRQQRRA
jgi:site-specific DNA recombinase